MHNKTTSVLEICLCVFFYAWVVSVADEICACVWKLPVHFSPLGSTNRLCNSAIKRRPLRFCSLSMGRDVGEEQHL